ncbi:TonB-dependent receptor [Idiomarina seosinensis]|uniref:TonB-dependent receptor n=1 Tax=Idiomarina seosinensis TaxID=281739 RepID=A0A432ZCT1_9GAMM|nr:TonB-dependent receptor [Idiomarina seosinensis]RUO75773.1 TonB-dependent receptor [Idiomarina seosinensis]
MLNLTFKRTAIAAAVAVTLSGTAIAQDTSSALRGSVATESGEVVSNAKVQVRDERTGSTRTYTTNEEGAFSARGLSVGGPYTIIAEGPNGRRDVAQNVYLTLGDLESVSLTVRADIETIQVTGSSMANSMYGSNSPAANFNLSDLQDAPAINRDLKDVIRADPRIYVDRSFGDGVQCVGGSPRFNSLTVDGVRLNDNFGLNSNGYPTQQMPFSYDAIEQVAVEFAPFDVQYGGFTACNINAVTKSGSNELKGGFFYDYTSDSFRGDELEGVQLDNGDYSEDRYGFNVGGAILKDKLFFFAAYEKFEGVTNFTRGPADSNAGTPVQGVSQAQLDEIRQIAQDIYNYDVGSPISSAPVEDEKLLLKLDWVITDAHRASLTYNWNDGGNLSNSDGDNDEYEFSNHRYFRGAESTSYVGQLFSDWTDNFSTEVRVGYSELDNTQETVGPKGFGDFQIVTLNDPDGDGVDSRATVYLGADDSRQANDLYYDNLFYKIRGTYFFGDHVISGGFEREDLDVFNMFVQHSRGGEYDVTGIDNFRNGIIDRLYYGSGANTNDPRDAAGEFGYAVNTAYLQDEYYYADMDMTITAGLRYDWYTSSDQPTLNPKFQQRYGYANTNTFDGEGLIQPRLGINWVVSPELEVRGGFGLYSGGNPNVWLANNFQNNGISQAQVRLDNVDLFNTALTGEGRPGYDVPQELFDQVANADGDSAVNALDPNFEIPSEWKYALGATYRLPADYILQTDLMYTVKQDEPMIKNIAIEPVRTLDDGRVIYERRDPDRGEDLLLTNASEDSNVLSASFAVSKSYDFGLDATLAYAYADAEDSHPMTSSVAYSNYTNVALSDLNDPRPATSNYEIPHRFTFRATYKKEFFDGYDTTISLFGSANKGRPYSFTFAEPRGTSIGGADITDGRQLMYIPTGADDSNVVFEDGFNQQAFFSFVEQSGLDEFSGRIAPRNEFYSDWWHKVDIRVEQELPGLMDGHKASLFFVIDNFTNMLNDDWGVLYQAGFPQYQEVVEATVDAQGRYVFSEFFEPAGQSRVTNASLWEARIGFEYKF